MKNFSIILLSILFIGSFCITAYCEEERKNHPSPEDIQRSQQMSQQQRPIAPIVIPQAGAMVPPTSSPHISAPQIVPQVINQFPAAAMVPQPPVMHSIPSAPTYAIPPTNVSMPVEIPQVPMIGNTIGKVMNKGSEKDGSLWLEVNDNLFDQLIKVKIRNLKNTPIVRQAQMYKFSDINIGDTVNAMYHTENDDNVANFINVMTEEEIEMWNQAPINTDLTVTPQKDNTQPEKQ
ncbi:MAG: hypothetical protein AABY55_05350 [Candidatus Omnitrophota bacterium]